MKKFIKIFFYSFLILVVGEITIRLNLYFSEVNKVFPETNRIKYKNDSLLNNIFVIGDSYTAGGGIEPTKKIINQIDKIGYNIYDLSASGDNWSDYVFKLKENEKNIKKGDIIFVGVNWNDVDFKTESLDIIFSKKNKEIINSNVFENENSDRFILKFYSKVELIRYLSATIMDNLKLIGYPLPVGTFNYFRKYAYSEKEKDLDRIIDYLVALSDTKESKIILYMMPNFNLLHQKKYMYNFHKYFLPKHTNSILVFDGHSDFEDLSVQYYIDLFDGHPNELAHTVIADKIKLIIKKNSGN